MTSEAGTAADRRRNFAIELLLLAAVGYNFVLAIVNAQLFAVSPAMAYLAELLIYAACFGLGVRSMERGRIAMVVLGIGLVAAVALLRFVLAWKVDPKFIRDAIIPFAFLVAGAAYTGSLPKLFLRLAVIVALVAGVELAVPDVYGDVVNPKSYYVNTRGESEEGFWNKDSNLYVSATRPGERNFLPGSNLARASSIFVEPVSTGNFIIFFCAVLLTFWRSYGPARVAFAVLLILFLIVASDGRLASGTCVLMLMVTPLLRRFDQRLSLLLLPAVVLAAALLVWTLRVGAYEDTMMGRVFLTVDALRTMPGEVWLGLDFDKPYRYFDSGIAYFIASQSVLTVAAFLLAYAFGMLMPTDDGQLFKNLFMLAFALSLLVSNSFFSVKTAALWWFACGALWCQPAFRSWRAAPEAHALPISSGSHAARAA